MLLLVQRSSAHRSAAGGWLFAVSLSSRCPFFFQTLEASKEFSANAHSLHLREIQVQI
jgi:hypothetical protein